MFFVMLLRSIQTRSDSNDFGSYMMSKVQSARGETNQEHQNHIVQKRVIVHFFQNRLIWREVDESWQCIVNDFLPDELKINHESCHTGEASFRQRISARINSSFCTKRSIFLLSWRTELAASSRTSWRSSSRKLKSCVYVNDSFSRKMAGTSYSCERSDIEKNFTRRLNQITRAIVSDQHIYSDVVYFIIKLL